MSTTALPRPIDPFATGPSGSYSDDAVVVLRRESLAPHEGESWIARTRHFAIGREGARLQLVHALSAELIDNGLADLLTQELFAPGWANGVDTFERLLTGVVLSCKDDPLAAWEAFYRGTLRRLDEIIAAGAGAGAGRSGPVSDPKGEGCLACVAPVYVHAEAMVAQAGSASLFDVGSCFGFFPLRVAAGYAGAGVRVLASDVATGTCNLLSWICLRLGLPMQVLTCDAACVPMRSRCVDTVTLLHLLEHLDAEHGRWVLEEALRLARGRVVVAVPLEEHPDQAYGHVRTLSLEELRCTGADAARRGGWRWRVEEHHGGWLILDRV